MCSFNQFYKITPDLWKVWMAIMRAVPSTKLWLIKFDAVDGPRNLKAETEAEGVDFSRIIISDMFPREREFLIKGLADVFLDTPEFNAHTTATDALWAGVPIVSLPGVNMAQRVAGSLCKDAGMSHLLVSCELSVAASAAAMPLTVAPRHATWKIIRASSCAS
jgi:protein O-GlcNAc transferase